MTTPTPESIEPKPSAAPVKVAWRPLGVVYECVLIGIIGAVFLGLIESAGVTWKTAGRFTQGWPWGLILAGFGKMALTHLLVWTPLLTILGLLVCRGRFADGPARLALLSGLFLVIALPIVMVGDLLMMNVGSNIVLIVAVLGCVGFGVGSAALQWRLTSRLSMQTVRRATNAKATLAVVAFVIGMSALTDSPLRDPAGFRVKSVAPGGGAEHRNVLWIVLDTVRADRLGVYGHDRATTPELAARSDQLLRFERAVTPGIWTVPGHATMFTGLSTREHGADDPGRWLDDEKQTIAERLRDAGYLTAGFCNNPWVSPNTNLSRGLTYYLGLNHYRHLGRFSLEYLLDRFGVVPPLPWLDGDYGAAMTNQLIADWLGQRDTSRPFFAFVNYMDAHAPYRVPHAYRARFMTPEQVTESYALRKARHGEIADVLHFTFNLEGAEFLSAAQREVLAAQYDASICYLDMRVGELLDLLERSGLDKNTLVVITSDHGEYLDEHGMWAHTFLAYEGVSRVPLLLQVPGRPGGSEPSIAQLADLFATVSNFATGQSETGPGFGTRDLLTDPPGDRMAITRWSGASERLKKRIAKISDPLVKHRGTPQTAIQDGRYKLLVSDAGPQELYDLLRDPAERENIRMQQPEQAERLLASLRAWEEAVPLYRSRGKGKTDADMLQDLAALGYAGGDEEDEDADDATATQPAEDGED